ncbi:MAG: TlpA disulfide reductase family protein [Planctomycetota bacterium]|nr:TlpA disulfide reductase family protein [Planctomycetota bacterium]
MLKLADGDFVTGKLVDSSSPGRLAWQSPAFTAPFEFAADAIQSIVFPVPDARPKPGGEFCFELAAGDVLFGSLIDLREGVVTIDASGIGRVHVNLSHLRRIHHWQGDAETSFSGPRGLSSWQETVGFKVWNEVEGHLTTKQINATIRRDFELPPQSRIEFEFSWEYQPDFVFALGVGNALSAFRLEVIDDELVVLRDFDGAADIVALQTVRRGPGQAHYVLYLDQPQGRLLVQSADGRALADLQVVPKDTTVFGGLQIAKKFGDLRLEQIRVSPWNGQIPQKVPAGGSRFHGKNGDITYDRLIAFDADRREFVVEREGVEARVAEATVQDVVFAQQPEKRRAMRVLWSNGQRFSGEFLRVEEGKLWLSCPGIEEEIPTPLADLWILSGLGSPTATQPPNHEEPNQPVGRLEIEGTALRGQIAESQFAEARCLEWHPVSSWTASPLRPGVAGRILYREFTPATSTAPPRWNWGEPKNPGGNGPTHIANASSHTPRTKPLLRTIFGDAFPCDTLTVDEAGVTFQSGATDATFLRHDQIHILEIQPSQSPARISNAKWERLLTVPRNMRVDPPTHVVQSIDRDYLRGRLIGVTDQEIDIEIRQSSKRLPRENVTRIIWVRSDDVDSPTDPTPPDPAHNADPSDRTLVQVVFPEQRRMTFNVEQLAGSILSGTSHNLSRCYANLRGVEEILIGAKVKTIQSSDIAQGWRFIPAAEPSYVTEADRAADGSALVGQAAPDFELDLVGGKKFKLSEHRDKLVVLDFWASWCAPCLSAMPQIHQVTDEFADRGVELLGVNIAENENQIQGTLDRLKLKMTVAFDREGKTAEKYGATSIPQTVIVDRMGNVVALFIGGGANLGEQLRQALRDALEDNAQ